ncbi:LuxR C-terminal-related transcriptional regulator [Anoxynatronum buryatiense]|uniref:LuxR family transcriptional regulator, maltose regulon positive regulatory protein n=1 Tax=Anoxynatronum buryatiense TaxID=489973 RepID=A0AA45WVX2_9CLOT|nr:LuxR C-terminal-related transcriptional regulator [Anoxynatronum buryatiense]SMP55231.1 LuxR family transcriptional regulator, maltose regulon positive regulatory protein [Anoxynatronum buryatiense]
MSNKQIILQRDRVDEIFQNIFSYSFTIVSAPMGYGKTTALREFFRKGHARYRWLCLREDAVNCGCFWNRLTQQIAEDFKKLGADLHGLGFPKDSIQTARVIETLMANSLDEDYCLVLDDYHYAENDQLNRLLEAIVKSEIPNFHLVIISRHLPKINLPELIVKHLAIHIDTNIFRFSDKDTQCYFSLMNFPLKKTDICHIQSIAGGWISALYLIYRGLKSGIPLKNITTVQELIKTTIYELYDEETKIALCALATLDTFTVDLAEKATGIKKIHTIIKNLYRENAFIEWDAATGVYTIHNVFSRFLNEETLRRGFETKEIYHRAGKWYLDKQDYTQAFRYLVQGAAYDTLLEVLERPALYINASDRPMLLQYFDTIPQQQKDRHPMAYLKFILLFVISGDGNRGFTLLKQFEKDLPEKKPGQKHTMEIQAGIHLIKMFLAFNDAEVMIAHIETALTLLDGGVSTISNYQGPFSFGSPHFTFIYYKEAGTYKKTSGLSFEKYAKLSGGAGMGADALCLAEYALETGNFDAVEDYAFKAIYKAKTKSQTSLVVCATLTLARLYIVQDKYSEALLLLGNLADEVDSNTEIILLDTYDLCLGYFYACTGEIKKIPRWITDGDMSVNTLLFQGLVFSYVVYGKILILLQDWVRAEALCETFSPYFDVFHNQLGYIHNFIHLSIAIYKQGDSKKAREHLCSALSIGQADSIVTPFVENGANLLPLLQNISKEDCLDMVYVCHLIELCATYASVFAGPSVYMHPLSLREIEVLKLIAKGLSRKEIAEKMFLSTGTIKSHTQNIYRKLNINKKSDALQKAAEMKLLS